MRTVLISKVGDSESIAAVAELAHDIWTEHYVPIIGPDQVDYMLRNIQSETAIRHQITNERFHYYLITRDCSSIGYIGVQDQGDVLLLSKVYVRASARGSGLGKQALEFVRSLAAERGHRRIRLTVNINNELAIGAYERLGFSRTGTQVANIGGGFVMDDYVYEMSV